MGHPHRPLLQILFGSMLERWFAPESVAFALGSGESWLSSLSGLVFCWTAFIAATLMFYHSFASLWRWNDARRYPDAPTSKVPQALVDNMIEVVYEALPLYMTVPVLTDFFLVKGWTRTCDSVEECGGWGWSLAGCFCYFAFLEVTIFLDHYYLLHKLEIGRRVGQHAQHHVYKYADQLNAFAAYAFAPQDGWSQGIMLVLGALLIRVPLPFVYLMEILTGFWAMYIHADITPLPWPFMGCDYHMIHHRYNWYNFGYMTVTMDTLFGTVKHPKNKSWNPGNALEVAQGRLPMAEADRRRSASLTASILAKRGASPQVLMQQEDQQEREIPEASGRSPSPLLYSMATARQNKSKVIS